MFGKKGNDKTNISADILLVFVILYVEFFPTYIFFLQMAKLKCGKILSGARESGLN